MTSSTLERDLKPTLDARLSDCLVLIKRISLVLLCLLTACGPIKGYEGPELPREQLGLVKLGTPDCTKCRIETTQAGSTEFFGRGVLLLPGKYFLKSKVVSWGEPYNCHTEYYYDSVAYSSCDSDRKEAQKKERDFYRNCSAEANKTREVCSVNFSESECNGGIEIVSNQDLEIVAKTTDPEDPLAPGVASMVIKPSYSKEAQKELTKLHTLEKPVISETQNIPFCKVISSGVW